MMVPGIWDQGILDKRFEKRKKKKRKKNFSKKPAQQNLKDHLAFFLAAPFTLHPLHNWDWPHTLAIASFCLAWLLIESSLCV